MLERTDLPGNTGHPTHPRIRGRGTTKSKNTSANAGRVTLPSAGRGKNFIQSVTTDTRPSQNTNLKAPSLNVNPKIKYSGKTIDSKSINKSYSDPMAGII